MAPASQISQSHIGAPIVALTSSHPQSIANAKKKKNASSPLKIQTSTMQSTVAVQPHKTPSSAATKWTEDVPSVQYVAENVVTVPSQYVRRELEIGETEGEGFVKEQIPIIDLAAPGAVEKIRDACINWGFFQVVNHGIPHWLLKFAMDVSAEFFRLPLHEKKLHANDPLTYVGYGSRLGTRADTVLDWGDYFFHHYTPISIREEHKWPSKPENYRGVMKEYCEAVESLCERILGTMSKSLGCREETLMEEFGGNIDTCVRINYYPACPEPQLTLGLSPHSDPGGITVLLQDNITGLQIKRGSRWISVPPVPYALTINIGDQMEIMTNGLYKSVEHRCMVNRDSKRMSIALFCNPCGQKIMSPISELLRQTKSPAAYRALTFNEYRRVIRQTGTAGKNMHSKL